jgi:hypothetical protein
VKPSVRWPDALLAQLVEHLHGKEGVGGSSPPEGFRKGQQMAFFVAFDAIRCVPDRPSTCPSDLSPSLELRCLLGLNTGIGDHGAPPSEEGAPRLVRRGRASAPKEPNGEQHSEAVSALIVRGSGVPSGPWPCLPSPCQRRVRLRWRFRLVRAMTVPTLGPPGWG